jgi:hypothetical protein
MPMAVRGAFRLKDDPKVEILAKYVPVCKTMDADRKRAHAAKLRFFITATSAQLACSTAAAIYCLANACKVAAVSDPVVMQPAPAPVAGAVEGADE